MASTKSFQQMTAVAFGASPAALKRWNDTSYERSIAAALTLLRVEAGLTQQQLADRAGWQKAFVSRLENGSASIPDTSTVSRYAEACGVQAGIVFASLSAEGLAHIHGAVSLASDKSETAEMIFEEMTSHDIEIRSGEARLHFAAEAEARAKSST